MKTEVTPQHNELKYLKHLRGWLWHRKIVKELLFQAAIYVAFQ